VSRLSSTGRRLRALLFAPLLLAVCVRPTAVARQPSSPAADNNATNRIDAVVTDAQGRAILDLRASDFELLVNGVAKPLQKVELRTLPRDPDSSPIENLSDEQRAARQPGARVFAFFLDEFHVSPGASTERVRQSITEFVDQKLRPQDLALVMKPLDAVTSIRFTRDRALLHGAIDSFAGRKGDYAPRTPFEAQYIGRAPVAVVAARRQIVTAGLRELTMRLGELQVDRGVIVLVSEGFPREAPAPRSRGADLQGVVRASSRFNLSTYTFNPATSTDDVAAPADRERAVATLQWLASQTGGRTIEAEGSIAGLARLAHDLETYYVLTYEPANADGRFHPVEVRARRRNLLIHARPGYWAPLGMESRAVLASTSASMLPMSRRALRRSPAIDAWVGLVRGPEGRARMVVSWTPKSRGVSAPTVVAVKARTPTGTTLFDGRLGGVGSVSVAPADSARFEVPPGRVELDLTIYDGAGKSLDTDARDVDVPDLKSTRGGPVLLAPELVRARTLRDFRSASDNPDAAPSPIRTFARGDRLLIRVPAFDGSGAVVQVTAKVLNEQGQPMRDIDALDSTPLEGMSQFSLPLSWLAPGDYLLEVLGTNANGSVRQRIPFTVTS
jgi:VWFA-related protein